jgi:hypothetical protein
MKARACQLHRFFLVGADPLGVVIASIVGEADRVRRDRRERH